MWNTAFIFSNRSHGLQKKFFIEKNSFFSVDYVKHSEWCLHIEWLNIVIKNSEWLNIVNDVLHMTSHAIWVDEITVVMRFIKKISKNLNIKIAF